MMSPAVTVSARQDFVADIGVIFPNKKYGSCMGRLRYDGTSDPIIIEDVTLAHLKIIIATKLRRQESFMMTWAPRDSGPNKRATV